MSKQPYQLTRLINIKTHPPQILSGLARIVRFFTDGENTEICELRISEDCSVHQ